MIKSYSLEEIDRTLYEVIRLKLVELGYLPDITAYTKVDDYENAKQAIRDGGKEVIEVFGVGTKEARGEKTVCEILIDRTDANIGSLGGGTIQYIENNDGTFTKEQIPQQSLNLPYEIRFLTNSVKYGRIITQILYSVLEFKKYFQVVQDYNQFDDKGFFIYFNGDRQISSTDLQERVFTYTVENIWVNTLKIISEGIPPLTTVKFIQSLKNDVEVDFIIKD